MNAREMFNRWLIITMKNVSYPTGGIQWDHGEWHHSVHVR